MTLEEKRAVLEMAGYTFDEDFEWLYHDSTGAERTKYVAMWFYPSGDIGRDEPYSDVDYCIEDAWSHYNDLQ